MQFLLSVRWQSQLCNRKTPRCQLFSPLYPIRWEAVLWRASHGQGENATGFTNFVPTMAAKWLEVLKEIAPQVQRAVLLFNPQTAPYVAQYYQRPFEAAAPSFGVQATAAVVHKTAEIEAAIAETAREPGGSLVVPPDNF